MIGQTLSHYRILSKLGEGGMGEVYLAQDMQLDRSVALKMLPVTVAADPQRMRRFIQEAKAASALNHPNILTIHEIGQADSVLFIATEFIDGETLRQHMTDSRMKLGEVLDVAIQVASALSAAHQARIVHRDIKPENIMVRKDGYIKVLDFGLAKLSESQTTMIESHAPTQQIITTDPGTVMGTVTYMSPEQARGLVVDARTDIWSLGAVLYEMLTGRVPFGGETAIDVIAAILKKEPVAVERYTGGVPAELEWMVKRALRKDREGRYQTAKEMLTDLRGVKQQLEVKAEIERTVQLEVSGEATTARSSGQAIVATVGEPAARSMRVALLYKRNAQPDEHVLKLLETELRAHGHKVFIDRHLAIGVEWAKEIERQVRTADAVVPLLSAASVTSEMLAYEVQIAHEAAQQQNGKPRLLPVRINYGGMLPDPLGGILAPIQCALWSGPQDDQRLTAELLDSLVRPTAPKADAPQQIEPPGGAVPLDSQFYIVRPTDGQFLDAIKRRDSIVLVKGARQMGKTSLLARGLQQAREAGSKVVITDFQKLNSTNLESIESLFLTLGELIAYQLDLDVFPDDVWKARRAPSINFERYIRHEVLDKIQSPLVWGLDEVDRLFTCSYGSEVFGLLRTWHNERAVDPTAPWGRLTLAIVYATEAHLFITDQNQSPFNVGTRLELKDFTFDQVAELNQRYGSPLQGTAEVARYFRLVSGHPYLVRRGLHEMATQGMNLSTFEVLTDRDEGPFGDHLRRILVLLARDPALCDIVRGVLRGQPCPTPESFYRLRSAGVMAGDSARDVKPRCQLYATYLERHLL